MKEIELIPTCSPKEIVKSLQGKIAVDKSSVTAVIANAAPLHGSKEIVSVSSNKGTAQYRAKLCIDCGCVSFDAKLGYRVQLV